jgi:cyclomaltodextrinase / maltogenic alpha-amylase / neopullulanase
LRSILSGMRQSLLGLYQHYKGTRVKVLSVALHSETKEEMVVYVHLENGQVWVRPLKMFLEDVVIDGKKIPRFKKVAP